MRRMCGMKTKTASVADNQENDPETRYVTEESL